MEFSTVELEGQDEKRVQDFKNLAATAGFDPARIESFLKELSRNEAFCTLAYTEYEPAGFYISRRVDGMPAEKRDERCKKRFDAVRRTVTELSGRTDKELAEKVADSGNAFVREEIRGRGIGGRLYEAHEVHAKKLGYAYKFEAARAPDEEGDAQRILAKRAYRCIGPLGYNGQRYGKPLYGFIKLLE